MSAFLCDEKLFNEVATTLGYYADYKPNHVYGTAIASQFILNILVKDENGNTKLHPQHEERVAVFARRLYEMNLKAVTERYDDGAFDDYGYQYKSCLPVPNKYALLKKISCLIYQCSEGDVPEMDLYKRLENIETTLAMDIVTNTKEYEMASWG